MSTPWARRLPLVLILTLSLHRAEAQAARDQARLQDLNFVSTQLPKLHVNFFFQLDPAAYSNAVSALQAQIPTLTDAQFYVSLAQLAAMAGDAHTYIALDGSAAAGAGFQTFPLNFLWLDDGIIVTGAAAEYSQAIGSRLVQIGETPIDKVVSLLATVIPSENPQWLHYRVQSYLRGQQILEGLGILPQSASSALTFQDLAGHQFTLQVSPATETLIFAPLPSQGPLSLYLTSNANLLNTGRSYSFTYAAASRLLYVRYLRCQNDSANPFPAFAASVLQTLDSNPVDTFVLDLRDNTGGDSNVINPLFNGLFQRAAPLLANPNFRAYEAINKGTFSSGLDDAMALKSDALQADRQNPGLGIASRFVVIGEPTGGKPAHFGSVTGFALPSSRLSGQYSTAYYSAPVGIPDGPSFNPDVAVTVRSTDFFARMDPVVAASLARASSPASAPSGAAIVVNGASFRTEQGIAPGSFASAFGSFGQTPDQILIGGSAAQIVNATSAQVNFVVPAPAQAGPASVSVRAGGAELASGQVTITPASPGLFILNAADPSQPGAVENQDYSINSQSNPAAAGSILQVFATGYGPLNADGSAPVNVYVADTPAEVLFSGSVAPGLWQINARVPSGVPGQASLYINASSAVSNGVTIWTQQR